MNREGIIHGLDEQLYHSGPELSSTGARLLLDSPAKYQWAQTHPQEHKSVFDLGTAVHTKVLGVGSSIEVLDFDSYRTKAAQEARDAAYADGMVPMLAKDMEPVNAMAEAVLGHPTARALLEQEGHAEASLFATDPDTGVSLRARFDYLAPIGVDLKSTGKSASTSGFMRSAADLGYEVQQEHYQHIRRLITDEHNPFVFVVVETNAPYLVGVHQLDREFVEIGAAKAKRAREIFAECTASGVWAGYPEDIQLVPPPMWAVYDYQDRYAS